MLGGIRLLTLQKHLIKKKELNGSMKIGERLNLVVYQ